MEKEKVDVNKFSFPYIPNGHEKWRKIKNVAEWYGYDKCRVIDTNVKYLCCHKVKTLGFYKLYGMRYKFGQPDSLLTF